MQLGPVWVYTPLFLIIFMETGLVVTPFLPGDSLLFCAGIFAADGGGLNIVALISLHGSRGGARQHLQLLDRPQSGRGNRQVRRCQGAFPREPREVAEDPGQVRFARGLPDEVLPDHQNHRAVLRRHGRDELQALHAVQRRCGAVVWVSLFSLLGYFFGGVPFVQKHFELVIVGIVVISLVPAVAGAIKAKHSSSKKKKQAAAAAAEEE